MGLSVYGGTGTGGVSPAEVQAVDAKAETALTTAAAADAKAVTAQELAAEIEDTLVAGLTQQVADLTQALDAKAASNDTRFTDARTPLTHSHPQSDVTGLAAALTGKANASHAHPTSEVTGLDAALASKGPAIPLQAMTLAFTAATAPAPASAAANVECFATPKMSRRRVDLTNATQVRLVALVVANGNKADAAIKVSYDDTETAAWSGTDTGCTLVLGTGTVGMTRDSGWVNLPAGAKTNVTIALLVAVANGTSAPTCGSLTVYVK